MTKEYCEDCVGSLWCSFLNILLVPFSKFDDSSLSPYLLKTLVLLMQQNDHSGESMRSNHWNYIFPNPALALEIQLQCALVKMNKFARRVDCF